MRPRAFTLVELLAVLLCAAILAATAAPALSGLGSARCAAAARRVQTDLAWARQRAMSSGATHWVAFSTAAQTWTVRAEDPAAPGKAGALTVTDPATGSPTLARLNLGEFAGVELTSVSIAGAAEVGFDRLGRPLSASGSPLAADGVVTLTGGHTVRVLVGSGLVTRSAP